MSGVAQESATITIYAAGEWSKRAKSKAMLGTFKGNAPSIANLFDGKEKVVFVIPGQFISIELPNGKHLLSASREYDHPDGKGPIELTIEPGGHYFYRIRVSGSDGWGW